MNRNTVSGIMITLLFVGTLTLAFNIQPAKAIETIYIRPDGSIDPLTAPIERDGDLYTLTDNITSDSDGIVIERNNMTLDGAGRVLQGFGTWFSTGVSLYGRTNVTIKGFTITEFTEGINFCTTSNSSIYGNNITNHWYGITLECISSNNSICGNLITRNEWWGINLYDRSSNNSIFKNKVIDNKEDGISLDMSSSSNSVHGNYVANNSFGIRLGYSSDNSVFGNSVTSNNCYGIFLDSSMSNTISRNNITANRYAGIRLDYSSNNSLIRNNIANPLGACIVLSFSPYNAIMNNNITRGSFGGINLGGSSNNTITNNNITRNSDGIYLADSSDNTITNNHIAKSYYGVFLVDSLSNRFYHNGFVDNTVQVYSCMHAYSIDGNPNIWDDGYPSGGNYWSNYEEKYPEAEEINDSGIWDTPYVIDENNQDNYPLMEPYSPLPRTIDELRTEIEELGLQGEMYNQGIVKSLIAKLNVAQKLVDKGKTDEARSILEEDFIPQVQNLIGKHITPEAAELLIESAEHIISNL